jgi:hypothetical protein
MSETAAGGARMSVSVDITRLVRARSLRRALRGQRLVITAEAGLLQRLGWDEPQSAGGRNDPR